MADSLPTKVRSKAERAFSILEEAFRGNPEALDDCPAALRYIRAENERLHRLRERVEDLQQAGSNGTCIGCGKEVGGGFDGDHRPECPLDAVLAECPE